MMRLPTIRPGLGVTVDIDKIDDRTLRTQTLIAL